MNCTNRSLEGAITERNFKLTVWLFVEIIHKGYAIYINNTEMRSFLSTQTSECTSRIISFQLLIT